ncbi:MAG: hypothetical protein R3C49_11110 [Planctomycetaceae bacterium]
MSISFPCPSCEKRLKVSEKAIGKTFRCPSCQAAVTVPAPTPEPPPDLLDVLDGNYADEQWNDAPDDESWNDAPAGDDWHTPPPPRRKKTAGTKSKATTGDTSAPKATESAKSRPSSVPLTALSALVSVAGILTGALLVWSMSGPGSGNSSGGSGATAAVDTPQNSLQAMNHLLQEGRFEEFLTLYAPIEAMRESRKQGRRDALLQQVASPILTKLIEDVRDGEVTLDESQQVATVQVQIQQDAEASGPAPAEGYGSDLKKAVDAAVTDLDAGRVFDFVQKMFPPEAIELMTAGPPGQSRLDMLTAESILVVRMLEDLKVLQSLTPTISGDTAEYVAGPFEHTVSDRQAVRPNPAGLQPPDRRIRFSLLNGHWRFFAGISAQTVQSATSGSSRRSVTLERVGQTWRLTKLP